MEEDNKYYTPTIEEFYTGFEYEYRVAKDKDVWETMSFGFDIVTVNTYCNPNYVDTRVKYLSKEDMESLGIEEVNIKENMLYCAKCAHDNSTELLYLYFIDYNTKTKFTKIHDMDEELFQGKLKNKSELKKILEMLNI